ncbi:MAG TPA: hypothetical protein VFW62_13205, partial [bacterium]|nr:hypothetical protein [bacterium]
MNTTMKFAVAFCVMALVSFALAQDAKKGKKAKGGGDPIAGIKAKLAGLDLGADQKEKIDKIIAEQGPKVKAAADKVNSSLTAEQRKARNEAQKAAKAAGKKGKEAQDDALAAMKLTDQEKKAFAEATKELRQANEALNKAVAEVLTA